MGKIVSRFCSRLFEAQPSLTSLNDSPANWIQGHNDVTGFKALVCHDGILNTTATWYHTEELYFPEHDLGWSYSLP